MNLDKKHYIMAAIIIVLIGAGLGREKYWSKTTIEIRAENVKLTTTLATQKAETEDLRKDSETAEVMEPVVVKVDGKEQIAYVTRKTSKTIETAMRKATEQIAQVTTENRELKVKLESKEVSITKSAPRWYGGVDWQPFKIGMAAWTPELGTNIGPFLAKVGHPIELKFDEQGHWIPEPHVGLGLRF